MPRLFEAPDEFGSSETNISPPPSPRDPPANRLFSHYSLYYSYYFFPKSNRKKKEYAAENSNPNFKNSSSDYDSDRDDDLSNVFGDFIR